MSTKTGIAGIAILGWIVWWGLSALAMAGGLVAGG